MEIETRLVDGGYADFAALVYLLDPALDARYGGAVQAHYGRFNAVDGIRDVVVVYADGAPVGCGGFKALDDDTVEIKRVFVRPEYRGRGLAKRVLGELERLAAGRGYRAAVLETGRGQPEAIGLYRRLGYVVIPNYGPYVDDEHSVCMRKALDG
jgi:GNAT superfamily N-acetyltransferase